VTPPTWDQLARGNKCTKHRTDGSPCRANEVPGTGMCRWHGGSTPEVARKGLQNKALREYAEFTNTLGAPIEVGPEEALLQEIARTNGHILWLQEQILTSDVKEFAASAWLYRRSVDSTIRWDAETERAATQAYSGVWLDLYQKERQHLARICQIAINAGIESRKVRLAERQAEQIGTAIMLLIRELGLDPSDPSVRTKAYNALTHASGGTIEGEVVAS
jgi:hypothetical protein